MGQTLDLSGFDRPTALYELKSWQLIQRVYHRNQIVQCDVLDDPSDFHSYMWSGDLFLDQVKQKRVRTQTQVQCKLLHKRSDF